MKVLYLIIQDEDRLETICSEQFVVNSPTDEQLESRNLCVSDFVEIKIKNNKE